MRIAVQRRVVEATRLNVRCRDRGGPLPCNFFWTVFHNNGIVHNGSTNFRLSCLKLEDLRASLDFQHPGETETDRYFRAVRPVLRKFHIVAPNLTMIDLSDSYLTCSLTLDEYPCCPTLRTFRLDRAVEFPKDVVHHPHNLRGVWYWIHKKCTNIEVLSLIDVRYQAHCLGCLENLHFLKELSLGYTGSANHSFLKAMPTSDLNLHFQHCTQRLAKMSSCDLAEHQGCRKWAVYLYNDRKRNSSNHKGEDMLLTLGLPKLKVILNGCREELERDVRESSDSLEIWAIMESYFNLVGVYPEVPEASSEANT